MNWVFSLLKNTTLLLVVCATLAVSTATLAIRTAALGTQLAAAGASAALAQRKAVATAVTRTKAKARLRRIVVALPLAGMAAAGYFEAADYRDWKEENPEDDFGDYACEVSNVSGAVIDEVLQDLPPRVRPRPAFVLSALPECETDPR